MHHNQPQKESKPSTAVVHMEINGHPYYIKSKGNVPYLYDIDTHDEVGYWSSKKGQYVMFSLYNKLMNSLKEKQYTESESNECDDDDDGDDDDTETIETDSTSNSQEDDSSSNSQEGNILDSDSEPEANTTHVTRESQKTRMDAYSLIFIFLILFVYLTLQKEFQSIYLDFVFLVSIYLLNTLKVFEFMNDE
jgi:hypothetical protein